MTCCGTTASSDATETRPDILNLEFLFLDESVCKPCGGTGQALDEAVAVTAAPLAALGIALNVDRIHVATREAAIRYQLLTSPTIRLDGVDIDPELTEGECGSCGDIAGGQTTVNCRTWHWKGEVYSSAPTGKIVEAILNAATARNQASSGCCGATSEKEAYSLPGNLEGFFQARENGEHRCC